MFQLFGTSIPKARRALRIGFVTQDAAIGAELKEFIAKRDGVDLRLIQSSSVTTAAPPKGINVFVYMRENAPATSGAQDWGITRGSGVEGWTAHLLMLEIEEVPAAGVVESVGLAPGDLAVEQRGATGDDRRPEAVQDAQELLPAAVAARPQELTNL